MEREFDGIIVTDRSIRWGNGSIALSSITSTHVDRFKGMHPKVKAGYLVVLGGLFFVAGIAVPQVGATLILILLGLAFFTFSYFLFKAPVMATITVDYGHKHRSFTIERTKAMELHKCLDSFHGKPTEIIQYTVDARTIEQLQATGMTREESEALRRKLSGLEPEKQIAATQKIRTLHKLLDEDAISQSEYNDQKWNILSRL